MKIHKRRGSGKKRAEGKSSVRLGASIEFLETRMLLTSVVVNTVSDTATGTGVVTLDDAFAIANSSTTPTTITFNPVTFAAAKTITAVLISPS